MARIAGSVDYIRSHSSNAHTYLRVNIHAPNKLDNAIIDKITTEIFSQESKSSSEIIDVNVDANGKILTQRVTNLAYSAPATPLASATALAEEEQKRGVVPPHPSLAAMQTAQKLQKLAAHINGDLFIGQSELEGGNKFDMMLFARDWIIKKIAQLEKKSPTPKLLLQLKALLIDLKNGIALQEKISDPSASSNLESLSKEMQEAVKGLTPGGPGILLGGGWTDVVSGHSIYFKISRNVKGTFRLEVFNTGDGLQYHSGVKIITPDAPGRDPKLQDKKRTVLILDNIDESRMIAPAFWNGFLELVLFQKIPSEEETKKSSAAVSTTAAPSVPTNYQAKDVYERLLPFLNGTPEQDQSFDEHEYVIPQHSGICSWASLMYGVIRRAVDTDEFPKIEHEMQMEILRDLYQSYADNPSNLAANITALSLLRKSCEQRASELPERLAKKVITPEEQQEANLFLKKVEALVAKAQEIANKKLASRYEDCTFESTHVDTYGSLPKLPTSPSLKEAEAKADALSPLTWDPKWKVNPPHLAAQLRAHLVECRKHMKDHPAAVAIFLKELFMNLPMPVKGGASIWNSASSESDVKGGMDSDVAGCMEAISDLSQVMLETCAASHADTNKDQRVEFVACLYKSYAIMHQLALRDKELIPLKPEEWQLTDDLLIQCFLGEMEHPGEKVFNLRTKNQISQLLEYFSIAPTHPSGAIFFDLDAYSGKGITATAEEGSRARGFISEDYFAYRYYLSNKDKFDRNYGREFSKFPTNLEKDPDIARATFSLVQLYGDYFPKSYTLLKRQALLAHFFLQGKTLEMKPLYDVKTTRVWFSTTDRPHIVGPKEIRGTLQHASDFQEEGRSLEHFLCFSQVEGFEGGVRKGWESLCAEYYPIKLNFTGTLTESEMIELKGLIVGAHEEGGVAPKELQVIKAIDYFSNRLYMLSEHNTRCLMRDILFQKDYMEKVLTKSPEYAQQLLQFAQKTYEHFKFRQDIPAATFMLYLGQMIKERIQALPKNKYLDQALEATSKEFNVEHCLESLLPLCKSVEEKALVYRQLAYEYQTQISALPPETLEKSIHEKLPKITAALSFLEAVVIPPGYSNMHADFIAMKLRQTVTPFLNGKLTKEECTAIAQAVSTAVSLTPVNIDWAKVTWKYDSPIFKGLIEGREVCLFNCAELLFLQGNQKKVFLPVSIRNNPIFQKCFPGRQIIEVTTSGNNTYLFDNDRAMVCKIGDNLVIKRRFEEKGPWHTYCEAKEFKKCIRSRILLEEKSFWVSDDNTGKVVLCDSVTGKVTHQMVPTGSRFNIQESEPPHRKLLNEPYKSLLDFEDPEYIHVWVDAKSGDPSLIEMPRLGLKFNMVESAKEKNEFLATSQQVTGYHIAENQHIPALGNFKNYLVLQNDGITKVIIPRKQISVLQRGGLAPKIALEPDFPGKTSALPPYFEYIVNAKGELEALHKASGNIFLAYILMGQRRYSDAISYLREKSRTRKRYTPREIEMFEWFFNPKLSLEFENDPKGSAVFLTAAATLWRNHEIYGKGDLRDFPGLMDNTKKHYENYLSLVNYMGNLLLTPEEELTIVKKLAIQFPNDPLIYKRLILLSNTPAEAMGVSIKPEPPIQVPAKKIPSSFAIAEALREVNWKELVTPTTSRRFLTRSAADKKPPVALLYDMAKNAKKEERPALSMAFELEYAFKNNPIFFFLAQVAANPDLFPSLQDIRKDAAAQIEQIQSLFSKQEESEKKAASSSPSTTPPKPIVPSKPATAEFDTKAASAVVEEEIKGGAAAPKPAILKKLSPIPDSKDVLNHLFDRAVKDTWMQRAAQSLEAEFDQKTRKPSELDRKEMDQKQRGEPLAGSVERSLLEDLAKFRGAELPDSFQLKLYDTRERTNKELESQKGVLSDRLSKSSSETQELKRQLLELANKTTTAPDELLTESQKQKRENYISDRLAKKELPFTEDDLCIELLRNNLAEIARKNPFLSKHDVDTMREMLMAFLLRITEEQALARQITALSDILKHVSVSDFNTLKTDPKLQELVNKASLELSSVRAYIPEQNLTCLVFEKYSGLRMRPEQVKNLAKLHSASHMILQMIMGGGKSQVLIPILALALADGVDLSLIVVPEALHAMMADFLSKSSSASFKRTVHSFEFDRNTEFTIPKLATLSKFINDIRVKKECLVITNKTALCLLLKFKEAVIAFLKNPGDNELRQKLYLLQGIIKLFRNQCKAIFDEVDLLLNVQTEINFTVGEPKKLAENRRKLTSALYQELLSRDLQPIFKTDPLLSCSLSNEQFAKEVKPILIRKMMGISPLADVLKKMAFNAKDLELINNYLLGIGGEASRKFIAEIKDGDCRNLLVLLKVQLNTLLPLTLNRRYCVNYGPSLKTPKPGRAVHPLAIPYSGNNAPVERSEFQSADITMNYTLQTYWQKGISPQEMLGVMKSLRADAISEKNLHQYASERQTQAYKKFLEICGRDDSLKNMNFLDINLADCEKIAKSFNDSRRENPERFFDLVAEHILSLVVSYPTQLTGTALDLAGLFTKVLGVTGTPWNFKTYLQKLFARTETAEGTDGKTAAILYAKTQQAPDGIRLLRDTIYPEIIDKLVRDQDDALIDAGAVFSSQPNESVARELLNRLVNRNSKKTGVIFFQKDTPMVLEGIFEGKKLVGTHIIHLSDSNLSPEERMAKYFTYYDQTHSTGTDIPQSIQASASITIGKDNKTRDIFQGVWRMRGIDKLQNISIALAPDAHKEICQRLKIEPDKITFKHILQFLNETQERELLAHIVTAAKQKVEFVLQEAILNHFLKLDFSSAGAGYKNAMASQDLDQMMVSELNIDPFNLYEKQEKTLSRESLKDDVKKRLLSIKNDSPLFGKNKDGFIQDVLKQIDEELGPDFDAFCEQLSSHQVPQRSYEGEMQRERQQQQQVSAERDLEHLKRTQTYTPTGFAGNFAPWWKNPDLTPQIFSSKFASGQGLPAEVEAKSRWEPRADSYHPTQTYAITPLSSHFASIKRLQSCKELCGGVGITQNRFAHTPGHKKYSPFYKRTQLPSQYLLFISGKQSPVLLDGLGDLSFFWEALSRDRMDKFPQDVRECQFILTSLDGTVLQHDKKVELDPTNPFYSEFMKNKDMEAARVKLLLGEFSYTKEQLPCVRTWIEKIGQKNISDYYLKMMFDDLSKVKLFRASPMYTWLGQPAWVDQLLAGGAEAEKVKSSIDLSDELMSDEDYGFA